MTRRYYTTDNRLVCVLEPHTTNKDAWYEVRVRLDYVAFPLDWANSPGWGDVRSVFSSHYLCVRVRSVAVSVVLLG